MNVNGSTEILYFLNFFLFSKEIWSHSWIWDPWRAYQLSVPKKKSVHAFNKFYCCLCKRNKCRWSIGILNMLTNTKYQDAHIEHGLHHQCQNFRTNYWRSSLSRSWTTIYIVLFSSIESEQFFLLHNQNIHLLDLIDRI